MAVAALPVPVPPVENPDLFVRKMSYNDYLRLPDKPKAEWLKGWAVIHMAPSAPPHMAMNFRLSALLATAFPNLDGGTDGPVRRPEFQMYPDIMLFDKTPLNSPEAYSITPHVAIEILSPSTRRYDLTIKSTVYLEAGIGQYWTVDTKKGEIVVRENAGDNWEEIARLDADHPIVEVSVGDYGAVTINREELFR